MYNTGNPVPSSALEDMADNAQVFDALVTKTEGTTTDRLGMTRRVFQQILMDMGFQPLAGSFQTGSTITARNQTLYDEVSHVFYSWGGTLPKAVTAGSTPATAGGIGALLWVDRTDLMLRADLASNAGAGLVGFKQSGASSVDRTVEAKLKEQAVNMLDFYNVVDGADYYPALTRAIAAIRLNQTSSRVLLVPYTLTYWPVSQTVLFNASDIIYLLHGDIKLTSTTRQKTLLFSYDTNPQPAAMLENVSVIGNGTVIDGNGVAMTFTYAHGDGSDNDSAIRFNYARNIYVRGVHATNGAIDSFSLRQCQNWLVEKCEFSNSKEDNGFSATTDFATQIYGDWDTYGYGWVVNCIAHNNNDLGMTAYNCSGVTFKGCRSYENGGGYSYEDNFASPNSKQFDGLFSDCIAYNNVRGTGWYVDANNVVIDDKCKSYNNSYAGTDTDNLYGHGVLISTANNIYVGGTHKYNQKAGLAIFNGASMQMDITVAGEYLSNKWHGIHARGTTLLKILPSTKVRFNGLELVSAGYGRGINVSNSGGATYNQGLGIVDIQDVYLSDNGIGGARIDYVKRVVMSDNLGVNNCTVGAGIGLNVHNADVAYLSNNKMFDSAAQTFAVVIESSVATGYDINNVGGGTTGVSTNLASSQLYSRNEYIGSATYDPASLADGIGVTTTVPVIGATLGDFAVASFSNDLQGITVSAWVSSNNVVGVRFQNETGGTIDLASGTLRAVVVKRNAG